MATDQYQVAAQENRIRVVPVEAPRGRILDRNGKVLVDNRISVQVTIDRTVLDELEDDERTACPHRARRGPRPCRASPRPSRTSRPTSRNQRYSPYVPVPVAGDVPGGPQDLDRRARRRAAGRRGRAGRGASLPLRPARRPRARLHRPDHRRGVRGQGRLAEAVHAQRQDREVRRREDLRGRPPRHARARARSRSTPRTSRSASSTRIEPIPATTSSSTSTSTCRRRPSRRSSPASRSPRTARAPAASRSRRPRRAPPSCSTRRRAA